MSALSKSFARQKLCENAVAPKSAEFDSLRIEPKRAAHGETGSIAGPQMDTAPADTIQADTSTPAGTHEFSLNVPLDSTRRSRLGRYELLEKLGKGGMGYVYRARDTKLNRTVALKRILEGVFAEGEDIKRFTNEARALARLDHPNIIPILDIGEDQGTHFFTMQLAKGGALSKRVETFAKQDPREAVRLLEKIARAVHYAHERQILHRDLKPANILLDEVGEPKVSDFGLVKFLDQDLEMTRAGKALGTRPYMSPEQLGGLKEKISPATDVWALGVVLYELLTDHRPFASPSEESLTNLITTADPPSPRRLRPQLERDLETIVLKCLQKEPSQRYASAKALADDLASWQAKNPIQAKALPWQLRVGKRLKKRPLVILVGMALALAFTAGFLPSRNEEPDRWVHDIPAKLKAGKPVALIGPTGAPKWSRWVTGDSKVALTAKQNKPFGISSWELSLLELVPDPGVASYRFCGEVKQLDGAPHQQVGLYFAQERQPLVNGWANLLLEFGFTDASEVNPNAPDKNPISLNGLLWREPTTNPGLNRFYSGKPAFHKPHLEPNRPWRSLAIEVFPDRARVFWQSELVQEVTWEKLNAASNRALRALVRNGGPAFVDLKDVNVHFGEHLKGLGLYVSASEAEFRNVVIEPLDDPRIGK